MGARRHLSTKADSQSRGGNGVSPFGSFQNSAHQDAAAMTLSEDGEQSNMD